MKMMHILSSCMPVAHIIAQSIVADTKSTDVLRSSETHKRLAFVNKNSFLKKRYSAKTLNWYIFISQSEINASQNNQLKKSNLLISKQQRANQRLNSTWVSTKSISVTHKTVLHTWWSGNPRLGRSREPVRIPPLLGEFLHCVSS